MPLSSSLFTQIKSALQELKRPDPTIHPADQQFAELLLTRPLGHAAFLHLARSILRLYRAPLEKKTGQEIPTGSEIEPAIQEALYADLEALTLDGPAEIPSQENRIYIAHNRVIVEFPYTPTKHMVLAPLKDTVADWAFNRFKEIEWSYPLEAIVLVVQTLETLPDFALSHQATLLLQRAQRATAHQQEIVQFEHYWQEFEHQEAQKKVHVVLEHPHLTDGRILYAHQREAIERLVQQGRLILAHDMGLGKTMSSLLAAQAYGRPVFVIAPVSTHIPWLREAETVGLSIEIYSWAKLPTVPEIEFVLIGDEAHMIQNLASQRTKAFLTLAERASAVYCVTGTPVKNAQANNLFPLLVACRHPLGQDQRTYEDRYCSGYMRRIGKRSVYEATGAVNLDELHEKTRDVILYKRKSECLDLPPKIRMFKPAENTPAVSQLYEETIQRLWQEHETRMRARDEAAAQEDEDEEPHNPDLLTMTRGDSSFARALVEMNILRHAASLAKVDAAIAVTEEVVEQGGSVVIFSAYRDTARQLALLLHADCLSGNTPPKERQAMIDRFQDRQTVVLVCTAAGGLGINLTAAQTVVLVDRAWTPGDVAQSEDRLHRIGQVGTVTSIWMQYGPMDDRVDRLLEQKQLIIDHVLTGRASDETSSMSRSILSSAREILQSIQENIPLDLLLSQREKELIAQAEAAAKAKQATPSQLPEEKKPQTKRARPGRPRKGGDTAALRERFEVTLDVETLQRLKERTTNRSAYIERLIIEEDNDNPAQFEQIQAKLLQRCQHFPPAVATSIQQIWDKRGAQAALEASEAVAQVLDPGRTSIP